MRIIRYTVALAMSLSVAGCGDKEGLSQIAAGPEAVCVSAETLGQLKTMIFDSVRKNEDDPLLLNDLERESDLKVDMPLLKEHVASLDRSICTGRIRLVLPTGSGPSFGGKRELLADVEYSAQPAADQSGIVYQVEGIEPLVMAIAWADLSQWTRTIARPAPAPVAAPQEATPALAPTAADPAAASPAASQPAARPLGRPSFDCGRARTFAEKTICESPGLSASDVRMTALYRAARQADLGEMRLREMQDEQQAWLQDRNACSTASCIAAAYDQRIRALDY